MLPPGGALEISYKDRSRVDVEKAIRALAKVYGGYKGGKRILDLLFQEPSRATGGTFTGCKEDAELLIQELQGTGVDVEIIKWPIERKLWEGMSRAYEREIDPYKGKTLFD